jgi:CRP-like cAMP-binding protein
VLDTVVDIEAVQQNPLFRDLRSEDLAVIVRAAQLRSFKKSAIVYRQGQPATSVFVIARGRIKMCQVSAGGQANVMNFLGPGQMFGGPAMFGDALYSLTAMAFEASVLLSWSSETIFRLLDRYPRLARNAMNTMAARISELQDRCQELSSERVEQRVARALLRLAQQTGKKLDGGILLRIRLSRQDLAQMTGTTLFSVSRILSKWAKEGLVEAGRQRVLLRRPHSLVCIAEDLPPPKGS